VDRRTALGVLCLLAVRRVVTAQTGDRLPTVGFLGLRDTGSIGREFYGRLRELGWIEGQTVRIERALWGERRDGIPGLAMDLVSRPVAVILAVGPDAIAAARTATDTIPIVMLYAADPVRFGYVQSLARPGGNVTGLTWDGGAFHDERQDARGPQGRVPPPPPDRRPLDARQPEPSALRPGG
jgi:putative ABC transport system substrate-binding protein